MANPTPAFPPIDRERFIWRKDPKDNSRHVREIAGGELAEVIYNQLLNGEQNLFLGVNLTLESPVPAAQFLDKARAAWLTTRFTIPTLASHIEQNEQGNFLLTYRTPADDKAARDWAERTVILESRKESLDDLRFDIGQRPIPDPQRDNDQTFLFVVPYSHTSYGLLLYTHHTPFDGVGTKVLMTQFLKALARFIANPSSEAAEVPKTWGSEAKNLLPVMNEAVGPDQEHEGERYQKTLGTVMGQLAHCTPRVYGFRQRSIGPGPTRRLGHKFSEEESAALIAQAKELNLNINQVAHAAMLMVCLKDNPPTAATADDALLTHNGIFNARRNLASPYNERLGYPGYAIAMSPVRVPVSLFTSNADKSDKEMLRIASQALKEEYAVQKSLPCLAAIAAQEGELMVEALKAGPPPPPWMGPWYSGDGIGETWMDPEYRDENGKLVIKLDDFIQSLNKTDPGPFFRSWTWAKHLSLSVDYNEAAMPREDVQGFLDLWARLIKLIL